MLEAFGLSYQMFIAAGVILGVACLLRWFLNPNTIPQTEIDAEARALIVKHGDNAVAVAESWLERSQWAKGKNNKRDRAERVLKAVKAALNG